MFSRKREHTEPEREYQLRTSDEEFGRETFEKGGGSFVLHHVRNNPKATLGGLKVSFTAKSAVGSIYM